ncbi:hypothetical protein GCM10010912_00920 [Paenibacillus albidus]|uniref:Uncharacterized protein n=1 Tax=Paenibacillus albidus TaxID=2041023 RepID=A0A917BUR8_9BACL|nr:hypothetical protein [Paenibacillus albidus]GGF59532.1 hypothetical protein GCM10010912_00920 [Paenibacillus albidus]
MAWSWAPYDITESKLGLLLSLYKGQELVALSAIADRLAGGLPD